MKRIEINFPTSWEEVSRRELPIIARCMLQTLSREEMLFLLFRRLCRIRYMFSKFRKGGKSFLLYPEQVASICKQLGYILDDIGILSFSPIKVDKNLIGVTFEQYYVTEALMSRYAATKDISLLQKAVRQLTGNKKRVSRVKAMEVEIWWGGIRSYLQGLYPYVLRSGDGASEVNPFNQLQEILTSISGGKPQDNKSILSSEVHSVLCALNSKIQAHESKS